MNRLLVIALLLASGCSLLTDHGATQCRTDADCAALGNHPYCMNGVCVPSGLGPPGCFYGQPSAPSEFANACTTAECVPFDNCARLGLCGDGGLPSLAPPADLGSAPPPVNTEVMPVENCVDPSRPNLIFVTGSTNFPPLLAAVAPILAKGNPSYTIVFQPQTSCKGAASIFDADPAKHVIKDITGNWAYYLGADGSQHLCLLPTGGAAVDVGESDVYAQTCGYMPTPGIADYTGPIQAITFVVPSASSQRSISAEAARAVFGGGGGGGGKTAAAMPWTNPQLYFVRSAGTGTIQLPSRAIGVPPSSWWGIDRLSAGNMVMSLEGVDPTLAEQAIGVLSSDFADKARANVRELTFQETGQSCGWLPDSSPSTFDKENVRDGHYPIWGTIHLFTSNVGGVPSQAAGALVTQLSVPRLNPDLLDAIIGSGYVPQCAMRVARNQEMGALASFQPQFGCGCYFDNKVNGKTSCAACSGSADCPSSQPACNYGFCELQ